MKSSRPISFVAFIVVCTLSCSGDAVGPEDQTPVPPAVTGKGVPAGTLTQATIGPAGGQLTSSDGMLKLTVPAGALASATVIGVQPFTNLAPGGSGSAYQLTPEGTTFATPVQLTFRFTDADLAGSTLAVARIAFQDEHGHWRALKAVTRDLANHELRVSTTHFSTWAQTHGLKLTPPSAVVQLGATVALSIEDCQRLTTDSEDDLTDVMPTCQPAQPRLPRWSANGVRNGNAANGYVQSPEFSGYATYSAPPSVVPTGNPVAVQAQVSSPIWGAPGTAASYSDVLLISNITVSGQPPWSGTVSTVYLPNGSERITTSATITFIWSPADNKYRPQGTLIYELEGNSSPPPCHWAARASAPIVGADGYLEVNGSAYNAGGSHIIPVTVTNDCGGSSTAGRLVDWWPPTAGVLAADRKSMAGTSKIGTLTWTWSFSRP